jgi:hypothetical protein
VKLEVRNVSGQDLKVGEITFIPSGASLPDEPKKVSVTGLKNVILPKDGMTQICVDFPAHSQSREYEGSLNATIQDASGNPLASPVSFYSLKIGAKSPGLLDKRQSVIISVAVVVIVIACTLLIEWKSKLSFFRSPDGDYSVSKAQTWLWGAVITYSFVYVFLRQGPGFSVPQGVWWLLGISVGSSGTAKFMAVKREAQRNASLASVSATRMETKDWMGKLVSMLSDDDQLSLMRLQMFFWTLVVAGLFLVHLHRTETLWDVPVGILVLMGISHAGYLGDKGAGQGVSLSYTDLQPKTLPTAQTQGAQLIIFGQNFAGPDDVDCYLGSTKLKVDPASLPNRLVVSIPVPLPTGPYDLTLQNRGETATVVKTAFQVT